MSRLEVERRDVERIATKALESGYYQGEARQELMNARALVTVLFSGAVNERKAEEKAARSKEFWESIRA